MPDDVTRRQFVDGSSYPPERTGMRGSHPGSFDVAHAIRDGQRFHIEDLPMDETVDLVVVGAGISGLAAAWFYRRERPDASILVLDNHDDFGGHAKRNEFIVDGRLLISYGGSESLQSPDHLYGPAALDLLTALDIDHRRFSEFFDADLYPSLGLSRGMFFDRKRFGTDRLVTGDPMRMVADDISSDRMNERSAEAFVADFPIPDPARAQLRELYTSARDPLPDLSPDEKAALLSHTSYRDFLTTTWGLDRIAADTFQGRSHDFFAIGIDGISALEAMETGYPGFDGMGLKPGPEAAAEFDDPYIHHFPDGNASIARAIVRSLITDVAPGHTMEDLVTARFDYGLLDRPGSATRLRLDSTAVSVTDDDTSADVAYMRGGRLHRVRAARTIMAGYHMMIPYLMPDLPAAQRASLHRNVKAPIVYVKVAVRNWYPWVRLGVHEITNPMGFHSRVKLDYPVSMGSYRCPREPDEPMVLHLVHVPTVPMRTTNLRETHRAAREILYETSFELFEAKVRDELTRMLGAGGFDGERDIAAITVNRWGHGYSYSSSTLFDPDADPDPIEIARARFGNVSFANADAAGSAYAHEAIAQGHRAAQETLS
jgi:spermidine dehydrogenase